MIYIHKLKHIYIQDSSNADCIMHRQPRLVMYANLISLQLVLITFPLLYNYVIQTLSGVNDLTKKAS